MIATKSSIQITSSKLHAKCYTFQSTINPVCVGRNEQSMKHSKDSKKKPSAYRYLFQILLGKYKITAWHSMSWSET